MSNVRIKSDSEQHVQRLYDEMWSAITPNSEGGFPYPEFFTFENLLPMLDSLFEVSSIIAPQEKAEIISQCFRDARRADRRGLQILIDDVRSKVDSIIKMPIKSFYLTTTVSFQRGSAISPLTKRVNRSIVSISAVFPKKLRADEWFMSGFGKVIPGVPKPYACLHAITEARTHIQAATNMLDDIDLFMSCLNLIYRPGRIILRTGRTQPLNRIRLGPCQLIHDENGNVNREHIWYVDSYMEQQSPVSLSNDRRNVLKHIRLFLSRLEASPLRGLLEVSLRQYNAALNMVDPQLCLIRLWATLEFLMQASASDGAKVTARRASFFSKHYSRRYEQLIHVAKARHRYVHAGTEVSLVSELIEDLRIYIAHIFDLLIFSRLRHMKPNQLQLMLDLPADPARIRERIGVARTGLKTRE